MWIYGGSVRHIKVSLAKVASKKTKHLTQRPEVSLAKINKVKMAKEMGKLKVLQYQQMVPQINSLGLKQRPLQLRHTSRRG